MTPPVLPEHLPDELKTLLKPYVADVNGIFGDRLEAVILYGSAARGEFVPGRSNVNVLLIVGEHDIEALRRYAKRHRRWAKENLVAPLVLASTEISATTGSFPLEYLDIQQTHVLLQGHDPFATLTIPTDGLRRHCLVQLETHAIRLRQRLIEAAGKPEGEVLLLPLALTSLLTVLRGIVRAFGQEPPTRTEPLVSEAEKTLGVPLAPLTDVWRLKRGEISPGPVEVPKLVLRYASTIDAIIERMRRP